MEGIHSEVRKHSYLLCGRPSRLPLHAAMLTQAYVINKLGLLSFQARGKRAIVAVGKTEGREKTNISTHIPITESKCACVCGRRLRGKKQERANIRIPHQI